MTTLVVRGVWVWVKAIFSHSSKTLFDRFATLVYLNIRIDKENLTLDALATKVLLHDDSEENTADETSEERSNVDFHYVVSV